LLIRMKIDVGGTFEGRVGGVNRGDVIDVPDANAARYIANSYAEPAPKSEPRVAVSAPQEADPQQQPQPESQPEPQPESDSGPRPLDEDDDDDSEERRARVNPRRSRPVR